jgi:hypothetical protein
MESQLIEVIKVKTLSGEFGLIANLFQMKWSALRNNHSDNRLGNPDTNNGMRSWLGQPQYFDETIHHNSPVMIKGNECRFM